MCTVLVTQMWLVLFQAVSWLVFNVHSFGDTECTCLVLGCELAWFLMCTPLVTLWPVMFQMVSWPSFQYVLFWWHRLWPVLSQKVSWPGLECTLFWWHRLSSVTLFQLVSWPGFWYELFNIAVACLVSGGELAWFKCTLFWWHRLSSILFQPVSCPGVKCALSWWQRLWPVLF